MIQYGYKTPDELVFDYKAFKAKRDAYVKSESQLFEYRWKNDSVELMRGTVSFIGPKTLEITQEEGKGKIAVTAPHICVAAGGYPIIPKEEDIPGAKYGVTHETFFALEELPKKIAIVGAGYIATEFAGILNAVGMEVHMFIRGATLLRSFDPMVQEVITKRYEEAGVHIHKEFKSVDKVEKLSDDLGGKKRLKLFVDGEAMEVDEVLWAIGRAGRGFDLNLDRVGVHLNAAGQIITDKYQNTSIPGIYAVGDVTGRKELQPGKEEIDSGLINADAPSQSLCIQEDNSPTDSLGAKNTRIHILNTKTSQLLYSPIPK